MRSFPFNSTRFANKTQVIVLFSTKGNQPTIEVVNAQKPTYLAGDIWDSFPLVRFALDCCLVFSLEIMKKRGKASKSDFLRELVCTQILLFSSPIASEAESGEGESSVRVGVT